MTRRRDPLKAQRSTTHALPHVTKHARDRMIETIGRDLTPDEWASVVEDVLAGRCATLSRDDALGYQILAVRVAGTAVRLTWRVDTRAVVTVLREGLHNHRRVESYQAAGVVRCADAKQARFKKGKRLKSRTRWYPETDPGRGSRFLTGVEEDEG